MTFCLGIKVKDGLIGLADTRIMSGNEVILARKLSCHQIGGHPFFLMTSGLRSVRDKAVTYFQETLEEESVHDIDRLFKAVNLFSAQIRRVSKEDRHALEENGLRFNIHALIGGQLSKDKEHKLYLLYPEGNWVEVSRGTPYCIIGTLGYGKPVLDRTLKFEDSMRHALKVGSLAFDSTRISASDVNYPIDLALYHAASGQIIERRLEASSMARYSEWWQERLRSSVAELPSDWVAEQFGDLAGT